MNHRSKPVLFAGLVTLLVMSLLNLDPTRVRYQAIRQVYAANSFLLDLLQQAGMQASAIQAGAQSPASFTKLSGLPDAAGLATQINTAVAGAELIQADWCVVGSPATTAARYMAIGNCAALAPNASPRQSYRVISAKPVTCTTIAASFVEAVQATDSITFCLEKPTGLTTLCTTLTPAATGPSISTGSVTVSAGEVGWIRMTQSGAAASTTNTGTRVSISCKSP